MDGFRATATASEASSFRGDGSARRVALLAVHNLWAWPFFAANTLYTFGAGLLRSTLGDPGGALDEFVPPPARFVAQSGILRVPVVRAVLRQGGHIVVERDGSAKNDAALAKAADLARRGFRISFFPEGTRSKEGRIGPFRGGAFRVAAEAEVPVVPLVLAGTEGVLERIGGSIRPATVAARYLPPRTVTPAAAGDPEWRESLRVEMAECLAAISPGTGPRL